MKIFGIGLNKTGTTTLGICLETLGYEVMGCDLELTRYAIQGHLQPIFSVADRYDGFQDWPWPLIYKNLDKHYPDSKFILTIRSDSETWFRSLRRHANRTGATEYRKLVYGHEMPQGNKEHHIKRYVDHNQKVREYFKERENDFLEVCWETGTGWQELCAFLGHEIPEMPVPHANKSPNRKYKALHKLQSRVKSFLNLIQNS